MKARQRIKAPAKLLTHLRLVLVSALLTTPQLVPAATSPSPDPWPRLIKLSNAAVMVYQPQVNRWDGDRLDFRAAVAVRALGASEFHRDDSGAGCPQGRDRERRSGSKVSRIL